ncbi:MAG: hypothetical protein IPO21_08710 [Bacteroidales bacterium]|nr:hypothetical protein [Bacteroidales bacterium]
MSKKIIIEQIVSMRVALLLSIILLSFSCTKKGQPEPELVEITDECIFRDNILSTCFYGRVETEIGMYVIRTNEEYQEFGDKVRANYDNIDCDTAKLPEIDFSKYSLISFLTGGSGCSAHFQRRVYKDTINSNIVYKIEENYEGDCEMYIENRNWAIVPAIPYDYIVEFNIKKQPVNDLEE